MSYVATCILPAPCRCIYAYCIFYHFQFNWKSKRLFSLLNLTYYYGKLDFFSSASLRAFLKLSSTSLGTYFGLQEESHFSLLLCRIQLPKPQFRNILGLILDQILQKNLAFYFYLGRID